ncbi:MAG: acylphosphatase [Desulfobacterales bacterium]|jgi:acylphosphatase|nr:acylphosphatase [Desulfobacterales bacterium]
MGENVRARVVIDGRVQGVAYRFETQYAAERIGVNGWVRNRPDGTVQALFEGERARVEEMIAWCRRGPALARVTTVDVSWEDYCGDLSDFRILR